MYKVVKDRGTSAKVALVNTETNARLDLGRISIEILMILEKDGTTVNYADNWDIIVNEDEKTELQKLAMTMKKPKRDQSKKPKDEDQAIKTARVNNKPVDVFDLIFGTD